MASPRKTSSASTTGKHLAPGILHWSHAGAKDRAGAYTLLNLTPHFQQNRIHLTEAHKSKEKLCQHLHDSKFVPRTPKSPAPPLQTYLLPVFKVLLWVSPEGPHSFCIILNH